MARNPKSAKDKYTVMFETTDGVKILEPKVKPSHLEEQRGDYEKSEPPADGKDKGGNGKRLAG